MRKPTMREVVKATAAYFGMPVEQLLGTRRKPQIVYARRIAMYLCRVDCGSSYPEIGGWFEKHHTSAIDAERMVSENIGIDGERCVTGDLKAIRALLNAAPSPRAQDTIERLVADLAVYYAEMA